MEVLTIGMIYIIFAIAAAMLKACLKILIIIGGVLMIISIGWGIYDRISRRKKCDIQKDTAEKQ